MERPMGSFKEHFDCQGPVGSPKPSYANDHYQHREPVSPLTNGHPSPGVESPGEDYKELPYKTHSPKQSLTYFSPQGDSVWPLSNRNSTPGLEFIQRVIVKNNGVETPAADSPEKEIYTPNFPAPGSTKSTNEGNEKKNILWKLLFGIACIGIAVGIGAGVGITHRARNPSPSATDNEAYYSDIGAFNGSGIALASQSFASTGYGSIIMYFQHHTGQLRSVQLGKDGAWKGGDVTGIVAANPKNGTPIAAVAYAKDNVAAWHIFYINRDDIVSEVTNSNTTNVWVPGPINDLNLQAMDDSHVGLQACWYGGFYSDVAYDHTPVPGQSNNTQDHSERNVGIHLWFASDSTTFESVEWTYGSKSWTRQQAFDGYNGHAGVGCYSWGPGSDTYVIFINLQDEVEILWKDLNTTINSTGHHPIDRWTRSGVTIPVFQNSSIGYTNYLYVQDPSLSISGYNVTWAAENTSVAFNDPEQSFAINGDKGLPGTHLSVTALPNKSGGDSLLAFYQTNGSDITEFVRDLEIGQWTSSSVPIPQS